jgi:demethylmenaquinone methyltransferase / 2-methoxy-6-polyprenyl-1,4-benzoquinol methylase
VGRGRALNTRPQGGPQDLPLDREAGRIEAMFSGIAGRYDLMNRIMTAGMDRRWRREAATQAALRPGDEALDVCCGTGDLAFTLAHACPACHVTGLDFTEAMLLRAREKQAVRRRRRRLAPVDFVRGDALALPFPDATFAAVTVGFGVRNVPDVPGVFAEMARVTRPGGRVVCLELTQAPPGLGRRFHDVWSGRIVPLLGRLVARDARAYSYLPASVAAFPRADELAAIMSGAGLVDVRYRRFGFGAVALHVGSAPQRGGYDRRSESHGHAEDAPSAAR